MASFAGSNSSYFLEYMQTAGPLTEADRELLIAAENKDLQNYTARSYIVMQGASEDHWGILSSGWAMREILTADGRRQVVDFLLPGSIFSLTALAFHEADNSIATLTPASVSLHEREEMDALLSSSPRIARSILWAVSVESNILAERLVSLGRRTAIERTAHFLSEIARRMSIRGMMSEEQSAIPVPQVALADALGISEVHLSRVLTQLQQQGFISKKGKRIQIASNTGLYGKGMFDPSYLHEEGYG